MEMPNNKMSGYANFTPQEFPKVVTGYGLLHLLTSVKSLFILIMLLTFYCHGY